MVQLEDVLKQKIKQINGDKARLEAIRDWIDGSYGQPKIIRFKTPDKAYHLVFVKDKKVELREGDYPSFSVSYQGSEENVLRILDGTASAKDIWQKKGLHVWGALNDALAFEKFLYFACQDQRG